MVWNFCCLLLVVEFLLEHEVSALLGCFDFRLVLVVCLL